MRQFMGLVRRLYGIYAIMVFSIVFVIALFWVLILPKLLWRRWFARGSMRLALLLMGVRLVLHDKHHRQNQQALWVANHGSYLDGPLLAAILPVHVGILVKAEAERMPLIGLLLKRLGAGFVERFDAQRGAQSLRLVMKRLKKGESIALFPEGTFQKRRGILPFKQGGFLLAAREKLPIVPMAITGTRDVFPDAAKLPRFGRIDVYFLPPLWAENTDRESIDNLMNLCRQNIIQKCGEPDLQDFQDIIE